MTNAPSPQNLLDAMDGIALLLDGELRIAAVGLAQLAGVPPRERRALLCSGRPPRQAHRRLLHRWRSARDVPPGVPEGARGLEGRAPVHLSLRCARHAASDAVVGHAARCGRRRRLLYQSVLLEALQRPPIGLFGLPVRPSSEADLLTICSLCARLAWPKGATEDEREWIEPPEYYRRGGKEVSELSHGFCNDYFSRLMAELD